MDYQAQRFIPAYAGNSFPVLALETFWAVHPRLRGELSHWFWSRRHYGRFIPAYAGNSIPGLVLHLENSVHPRLRGELGSEVTTANLETGSSPLTRGTLIDDDLRH